MMRRLVVSLVLVALIGGVSLSPAQRSGSLKPSVFAIRDAKVFTPNGSLDKATVVLRDGLIEDVGPDVKPPADAIVIEGKGMSVYPGFVDALCNRGFDGTLQRSAVGDPAEEELNADALAATKPDNRKGMTPEFQVRAALKRDAEGDNWRKAGITAQLSAPDAGIFGGQSAVVSLSGAPPREAVLRSPVAQHLSFRAAGGFGGGGGEYPRVLMGLVAHTRQTLLDAGYYARLQKAFEESGGAGRRPPQDPALEALAPVLAGKMPVIIEADTRDQIDRALDFAAEFKMKPILFGGREAYKSLDRLAAEKVPVILRLDFTEESSPLVQAAEKEAPARVKKDRRALREKERSVAAQLHKRGVPFAFSSHGLTGDRAWEKFRTNLRQVMTAGLSEEACRNALTRGAATILGVEKQLGGIAKGKAAHLVVMNGEWNQLTSRVRHVFVDGIYIDPDAAPVTAADAAEVGGKRFGKGKGKRTTEEDPPAKTKGKGKQIDPPEGREDVALRESAQEKEVPKEKGKAPDATAKEEQASETEDDRKPATRTGGNVLLKGATVLPVSRDAMPATDILVQNGKIAAVGKSLEAPSGVKVIDLAGYFVMPGVIDTHCHFAISGGVNEGTLSVVPEVRIRDVINSEDVQIYRALAGGVTTARLLHGSANVIGGQDAVIKLKYGEPAAKLLVTDGPRGVKFALGENVKRTDGRFPNTRLGVEAVLVRAFTEAQEYKKRWDAYKKGETKVEPRRDLRLEALADVLRGDLKIHCHCYRADEILMLLRTCERFGVRVQSLQHVLEGYKVAPEIAKHGCFVSPFSDWWAYKWEAADAIPHCAALLREAGVPVCLKSDSNELMRHMYQEAAKLVKYGGLSETEALKTVSLTGAAQLGIDKRTGSIDVGKDADLAVFNGHPLNSYSRVEMTLVEGEVYFERKGRKPDGLAAQPPAKPAAKAPALPAGDRVLIIDATVHPVTGPVIEKGTVEIRNGKIHDIRPTTEDDRAFKGRVDAAGYHVYPGMIDAGTVIGLVEVDSARETMDHREGGDFQPDLKASTGINPDSELIPVTRANGVLSVVTRPTGGIIAGQGALVNLAGWVPQDMAVVDPLALHVELPGGFPGIGRGSPFGMAARGANRRVRDAKLKRLRELFNQAIVYDRARKEKPDTPANPRLEALAPYATGARPVIVQASRKEEILEALKLADELKIKLIVAGGLESWKVAEELKKRDVPVIVGPVLSLPTEGYDPYDAPYACAAKLHAACVRFCIRSTGDSNTRNLPYQAAMAVSYGLPAEEGLKAVTLYPAKILGVEDKLGSLDKGRLANLVIATGDVLQASTQVVGLYVGGKPYSATSKHTRLYERYRERLKEVNGAGKEAGR
jgi:imidazolonepropionase-like amidohydrolase